MTVIIIQLGVCPTLLCAQNGAREWVGQTLCPRSFPQGWRLTHRSLLPLGLCFPARARSSSSEGCLYRKRLRAKTGSQDNLGMGE